MADIVPAPMTVDEFLVWAEDQSGRYDLENGAVFAVSQDPGLLRIRGDACDALAAAILRANLPCEALLGGALIRIDAHTAYEPDAVVRCGAPSSTRGTEMSEPVVVVEIASSGPDAGSRGGRLIDYSNVPGIEHYLIVDPERRVLVHHARRGDEIATRILHGGPLRLDPPGLDLAVEDLFGGPAEA